MAQKISTNKNKKGRVNKGIIINEIYNKEKLIKKHLLVKDRMEKFIEKAWPNYKKDTLLGKRSLHIEIDNQP